MICAQKIIFICKRKVEGYSWECMSIHVILKIQCNTSPHIARFFKHAGNQNWCNTIYLNIYSLFCLFYFKYKCIFPLKILFSLDFHLFRFCGI